mmetsp:Transcript_50684/g.156905  ORF Transcript_50684/g.156905 Transcript_50684/m.156905 type:complete len:231 (-) Transcript_50684:67-759(-)
MAHGLPLLAGPAAEEERGEGLLRAVPRQALARPQLHAPGRAVGVPLVQEKGGLGPELREGGTWDEPARGRARLPGPADVAHARHPGPGGHAAAPGGVARGRSCARRPAPAPSRLRPVRGARRGGGAVASAGRVAPRGGLTAWPRGGRDGDWRAGGDPLRRLAAWDRPPNPDAAVGVTLRHQPCGAAGAQLHAAEDSLPRRLGRRQAGAGAPQLLAEGHLQGGRIRRHVNL